MTLVWPDNPQLLFTSDEGQHSVLVRRALRCLSLIHYKEDELIGTTPRYRLQLVALRGHDAYLKLGQFAKPLVHGMSDSQLVHDAFELFRAHEDFEAHNSFSYAGIRIFSPLINVDALCAVANEFDEADK